MLFFLKRVITSINQPRSVNMTDELADELDNKKNDEGFSGIDIEEAKQKLKNEDQYDKQLYRERIKRMHREKRLKEKDLRRAKRAKTNGSLPEVVLDNNEENENENFVSDCENDEESDYEEKRS
jgi:hypothetical protein